jgi:hypothetical protein
MQDFSGGRDADDIVSYLTKQAGNAVASTKLDSAADAVALAQKEEVVIVRHAQKRIAFVAFALLPARLPALRFLHALPGI